MNPNKEAGAAWRTREAVLPVGTLPPSASHVLAEPLQACRHRGRMCVALTGDPYAIAGDLWRVFHAGLNLSRRQRVQRPFDRTSVAHLAQRSTSSASDVAIADEDDAIADDDARRS